MHNVIELNDTGFSQYWERLYANDPAENPMYLQTQRKHMLPHSNVEFSDRSFLVMDENEPVFACNLTSHVDKDGRKCVGYFGAEASSHVSQSSLQTPSNNFEPEAIRLLQQHINQLIEEIQPDSLDYLDPVSYGIMSPVTQLLLQRGAVPTVQTAQIIDLSLSQEKLYRAMSEECRSRVDWGLRSLSIDIVSGRRFEKLKPTEVDRLLAESSEQGSNTILHNKMVFENLIHEGKAFLIQARYQDELVSSSLFVHTDKTAHFVFGDVLPAAPNKPVIHALVWQAILHCKAKECNQFDFGCSTLSDMNQTTFPLEHSKSSQFGGKSQPRLKVSLG